MELAKVVKTAKHANKKLGLAWLVVSGFHLWKVNAKYVLLALFQQKRILNAKSVPLALSQLKQALPAKTVLDVSNATQLMENAY